MTDPQSKAPTRSRPHLLSTVLFVAALGFAGAAIVLWYLDDSGNENDPPIPTATPGLYGLVNVLQALEDAGLDGDYGRSPAAADSNQIPTPGQHLRADGHSIYVFIFTGTDASAAAEARATTMAGIDPATMTLTTRTSGADVTSGDPVTVYDGANVIAVLIGGDSETQQMVQSAIESLDQA